MSCDKFCSGGKNTNRGLVAERIDNDLYSINTDQAHSFKGVKENEDGDILCPIGCTHYPTSKEAAINLIKNGTPAAQICRHNPFRYHKEN